MLNASVPEKVEPVAKSVCGPTLMILLCIVPLLVFNKVAHKKAKFEKISLKISPFSK
jgi:hypothetical protein